MLPMSLVGQLQRSRPRPPTVQFTLDCRHLLHCCELPQWAKAVIAALATA
jgi:hypothetical protein